MPNVNTVNFGPGQANVDLQAQQVQLQRQQQIADMLRQQSVAQTDTQMVSGHAVKNSPWLGVTQMAKALLANKMQSTNDAKQTELGNTAAQRSAAALRALAPAGMFDSAPDAAQSGPLDAPMGEPGAMPEQPQPLQQPQQAAPQVDPAMREKWARALTLSQTNPELGGKLIQNLVELTGNQKDWAAQGVDPRALGAAMLRKEQAGGLVNVAPNNTVLDAGTNKPVFAAPDFANGRSNTFGPNGAPQIAPMQGAETIPQQAGAIEAAKSAAQAGQDMVTVNTPQGPVMMTRAQAVQQSSGGQPQQTPPQGQPQAAPANQGFPVGTRMPAPTPGMQSRGEILQQELAAIQARPDSPQKAADLAAIQREIGGTGKVGSMPGIPLQSEASREEQVGGVRVKNAVDEALAKQLPQDRKDRQIAIAKGESALSLIDKAMKHPGLSMSTGLQGTLDPRNYIAGTKAKDFQVVMDQLSGQTFLQAMESLRGTGQITEIEGKKASDAIARLNRSQSTEEFKNALADFRGVITNGLNRTKSTQDGIDVSRGKLNEQFIPGNGPVRKYNPATGRIE